MEYQKKNLYWWSKRSTDLFPHLREYIIFFLCHLFISCSSSLSSYYSNNNYIYGTTDNFVVNDTLNFLHKSRSQFLFEKSSKKILSSIPTVLRPLDSILLFAKSPEPPFSEYYVLLNSNFKLKKKFKNFTIKDTTIKENKITIISKSEKGEHANVIDSVKSSVYLGKKYRENFVPLYSLLDECYKSSNLYYNCLKKIENFPTYSNSENFFKLQMQLTFSSFLGENLMYEKYLKQYENKKKDSVISDLILKFSHQGIEQTIDKISRVSKNSKILMVNENHFYPNHRIFITKLLGRLKSQGFNYLALEALELGKENSLNQGGNLEMDMGFYTREQNYIDLISNAQKLGFKIISYDDLSNRSEREINQAKNIYSKTFKQNPKAKVVVLAGISHILEKKDLNDKFWMAYYFKEKFNIDPITFSQTHLNSYKELIQDIAIIDNKVFEDSTLNSVDYHIINNLMVELDERPNFLFKNKFDRPIQLSIFYSGQINGKAIQKELPVKNFLVGRNEVVSMALDKSKEFGYVVFDEEGNILEVYKKI